MDKPKILLSFDTEEFDLPREHGVDISLEEGMKVSVRGTNRILDCLKQNQVKATFFCTANFAKNAPEVMKRIIDEGHEVACHGVDHFTPLPTDVEQSKKVIEGLYGVHVKGYRQPRMFPVSNKQIKDEGYLYNSSLNPAFIPGRYMHLDMPRTCFVQDGVLQIPSSVTPIIRFPLFWLANHVLPIKLYHWMIRRTLRHDGYFTTYMHPWEFCNLKEHPEWKTQAIIKMNCGDELLKRLDSVIKMLKSTGGNFVTYTVFAQQKIKELSKC